MKKTLPILILTLMPLITFAQSAPYKDAFEKFSANYNADNFKGIFDDFSEIFIGSFLSESVFVSNLVQSNSPFGFLRQQERQVICLLYGKNI